ncbi:38664_t:CDS:2, partial [Gigaspora margarita]
VTLLTPQNVQRGSTIAINWTFSGIQTTPVELLINNTEKQSIKVIDNDVDLAKKSKIWNVTVDNGNYVLCLRDKASYTYVYSDAFTVSQAKAYYAQTYKNNTYQPNNSNDQTEGKNHYIGVVAASILGLFFIIFLVIGCRNAEKPAAFFFLYLLAYILPPLCVVLVFTNDTDVDPGRFGKVFHIVFSLIGTLAYVPGAIHALYWVFVSQ